MIITVTRYCTHKGKENGLGSLTDKRILQLSKNQKVNEGILTDEISETAAF